MDGVAEVGAEEEVAPTALVARLGGPLVGLARLRVGVLKDGILMGRLVGWLGPGRLATFLRSSSWPNENCCREPTTLTMLSVHLYMR